jgi:osomolarity two-component system response regulator SKN7
MALRTFFRSEFLFAVYLSYAYANPCLIISVKHNDSMPAPTAGPSTLPGPSSVPQPKTPVLPPPLNIDHSMTPSTHPPPSLFATGTGIPASAAASLFASSQSQPSPFLQPLSVTSPAPPPQSSSSSLLQALGRTHSQSQASQGASQALRSSNPQVQFLPAQEAQRALGLGEHADPNALARASLAQMNEMSRRAESGLSFRSSTTARSSSSSETDVTTNSCRDALSRISQIHLQMHDPDTSAGDEPFIIPPEMWEPHAHSAHEGLQVFTLGHLLPRSNLEDRNGNWTFPGEEGATGSSSESTANGGDAVGGGEDEGYEKEESPGPEEVVRPTPRNPSSGSSSPPSSSSSPSPAGAESRTKLRVRRSTFVPGWAVPPRVLLVDDDAVSRRLSSKFLQVFGCAIDVAVDGVGAVTKMNLEKYDLVLMVRLTTRPPACRRY